MPCPAIAEGCRSLLAQGYRGPHNGTCQIRKATLRLTRSRVCHAISIRPPRQRLALVFLQVAVRLSSLSAPLTHLETCALAQTVLAGSQVDPTGQCVPMTSTLCVGVAGLQAGSAISFHIISCPTVRRLAKSRPYGIGTSFVMSGLISSFVSHLHAALIYVNATHPESVLETIAAPLWRTYSRIVALSHIHASQSRSSR